MPHKDREARKTYARLRARKLRAQCAMSLSLVGEAVAYKGGKMVPLLVAPEPRPP